MRIGLPLDGWLLAVVGPDGQPVEPGDVGELIIGGVGLARYLDAAKDAEKFAPFAVARLGPRLPQRRPRALRPGRAGVRRPQRRTGQTRRPPHRTRRGGRRAAGAARRDRGGGRGPDDTGGQPIAGRLRGAQPRPERTSTPRPRPHGCARLCRPRSSRRSPWSTDLPTRTSGKVDRAALPWPLQDVDDDRRRPMG